MQLVDGATPLPTSVTIREVGPRDGLQLEAPLSLSAKVELLAALVNTGVQEIEATAFVSPKAVPSMADATELGDAVRQWPDVAFSALVPNTLGAKRAVAAGFRRIEYVVSASDGHSLANVGRTTAEATAAVSEVAQIVHDSGGILEVIIATAWDCPFDGPTDPALTTAIAQAALEQGADALCLGDTIGTATPVRARDLFLRLRALDNHNTPLGAHFHNTRGTGLASAWAAVAAGVTRLDASVGGLGGCPFAPGATGNIATEELVYMLEECGITTGIDLDAALDAARLVAKLVGHSLDSAILRAGGRSVPLGRQARPNGNEAGIA